MPHTKSAKKSIRQIAKRRARNRAAKKGLKTQIKSVVTTAQAGSTEDLQKQYNLAAKKLDMAAAKGVIHRNLAARKKSQLARLLNQKKKAPAATGS
jgi:small subunit ribosomal protein S20